MVDNSKTNIDLNNENKIVENTSDVLDDFNIDEKDISNSENIDLNDILEIIGEKNTNTELSKTIDSNQVWITEYEKNIHKASSNIKENNVDWKIIFDINISSLDIVLDILIDKEYDFVTFEPSENSVKINFRKNKIIQEARFINHSIYSNILIKTKTLSKLTVEETENEQEWDFETKISDKFYKVSVKVVPSNLWSKLFVKAKEIEKKAVKKVAEKISISKALTYLGILAFVMLIVWGIFISFVVINAKTVDDVKFFSSLWINLNNINSFILQAVTIIFSTLVFIETLFLIVSLFKFLLTKKEFKQKKVRFWIVSVLLVFIAFWTGSAWMIINKKILDLPKWQEMAYWEIQIYDNSKLTSKQFDNIWNSLLKDTSELIGPMNIKYDLTYFAQSEKRKWLTIKKYIWDFWDNKLVESPIPTIIHNFNEKWNYEVKLKLEEIDSQWKIIEKELENIPNINISHVVIINEKELNNWWKMVDFDASSLSELGKIEWYFMDNLDVPVWTWEKFIVWKPIFEETLVWMYIRRNDKKTETIDKLFIISGEDVSKLDWEITYTRWIVDDLNFEFKLENLKNDFWNWYIEEFKWVIWDKQITKKWDILDQVEASKINFKFDSFWDKLVKVIIKNSAWESKEISKTINIPVKLSLSSPLKIENEWKAVENMKYDSKQNEYSIDLLYVPTEITIDARFIKASNSLYSLNKVSFDYNSDWDIDEVTKQGKYDVNIEWNHTIKVLYEFINRRIKNDIINMEEKIYIEWVKKEAILTFDMNKDSNYVPVIVSFDASKSQVKNENIEKFIWDYWDWVIEERDALVPWHKYSVPWDYKVKLRVITSSWKEYSISKTLVLKPKPQRVKISTSMLKAPIFQWIDFSSADSQWQIVWYFWKFWDWESSTEANPTHEYKKAWKYKVTLTLDFENNNIEEDTIDIEIVE